MRIGFHFPFSGSLNKLKERITISRGNTFQIYARSLRGVDKNGNPHPLQKVSKKQVNEFLQFKREKDIDPMIIHAPYFYNLAKEVHVSKTGEEFRFSDLLLEDLELAKILNAKYYILQPGYSKDVHPILAIENLKMELISVLEKTDWDGEILIKNMSGAGSELGSRLEEWNELISFHPRVKGALDFSRMYSAGYSFTTKEDAEKFYNDIEEIVSWEKIKVAYINDNDRFCGSKKNLFPPLGHGVIGFSGYEDILKFDEVKNKIWIVENQPELTYVDQTIKFLTSFYK